MINLEITSTIASVLALIMLPLTLQVSLRRTALGKAQNNLTAFVFGDGDDETLRRRIRAFGNFVEYVPLCLIMLGLLEIAQASHSLLWSVGGLLVGGRLLHAVGMLYANNPASRGLGMLMTYGAFLIPAVWLLTH